MAIFDSLLGWLRGLFSPPSPLPVPPVPPVPVTGWQTALLILDNKDRRVYPYFPALVLNPVLVQAAQEHADWMAAHGTLSHNEGSDGLLARLTRFGYSFRQAGENIAQGYTDVPSVHAGWMADPPHRANIINGNYAQVGYGHSGTYWCGIYAMPILAAGTYPDAVFCLPTGIVKGEES